MRVERGLFRRSPHGWPNFKSVRAPWPRVTNQNGKLWPPPVVSPQFPVPIIAKITGAAPEARLVLLSLRRSDVVICPPPVPPHKGISRSGIVGTGNWGFFVNINGPAGCGRGPCTDALGPLYRGPESAGGHVEISTQGITASWSTSDPRCGAQRIIELATEVQAAGARATSRMRNAIFLRP